MNKSKLGVHLNMDVDSIRKLHCGHAVPTDGSVYLHAPQYFTKRNVHTEKEHLVNNRPVNVVRNGREYVYTLATGQKYSSFYKPHEVQWTPGP